MIKKITMFMLSFIILTTFKVFSQDAEWKYLKKITFPVADSAFVQPLLCAADENNRFYVISSKVTSSTARNAIFFADTSDNQFTKLVDYYLNGEQDSASGRVHSLLGITTVGNDVVVSARLPNVPAGATAVFYYPDADTNQVQVYGFGIQGSGWGTPVYGISSTKDSVLIGGILYQGPSFRFYNFSTMIPSPGYGSYFFMASQPLDPGGPHTNGFDAIRDVATVPDGDYSASSTPFFSSRNSYSSTQLTGGVTLWEGGSYSDPSTYSGQSIEDPASLLNFDSAIPYGITIDNQSRLWVAGIDSLRRWVKGFDLLGAFAAVADELPSQNSFDNPNPDGAPMVAPSDVVFTKDGLSALVIDAYADCGYLFEYKSVSSVKDPLTDINFSLLQNYPNPFNPSTLISYNVDKTSKIKLTVSDVLGREIAILVDETKSPGTYNMLFNASELPSGIYFYSLNSESRTITKKMNLVK